MMRPVPALRGAVRADRGMSLIELFMVVVLFSIFFGAVYESVIIGLRVANASEEREALRQEISNALDQLTREVSLASNLDNAEDQRVQFDADLDGNGTTENNVNYQVSSGAFERAYNGATVTLIKNVTALDFDYLDSSGANLATPISSQATRDTVRVVQVTVTATKDNETISMASAAFLHNQ